MDNDTTNNTGRRRHRHSPRQPSTKPIYERPQLKEGHSSERPSGLWLHIMNFSIALLS